MSNQNSKSFTLIELLIVLALIAILSVILNSCKIGTRVSPYEYFKGLIDEVRIYNRALSADEIKALYDATK
jgi:prepilin-type N-terminal cleavage/methylation domain-containing protein